MRTTNAQESNQLLVIQSQALFVIHYLTYKSKIIMVSAATMHF